MKIYHTETQEDYDALMVELEAEGIETIQKECWEIYRCKTIVFAHAIDKNHNSSRNDTTYSNLTWAIYKYPNTPIFKYKAKADEKMRFTKQDIERVFNKFMQGGNDSFADLKERIINLVDEPEKVVVPKFVAEFYEKRKHYILSVIFDEFKRSEERKVADWYIDGRSGGRHVNGLANSQETIAKMHLYGYTIEPEKLYYIPLPHLETSDGKQQVLSKRENDENYFASRPTKYLKQRFTKEELERVPEVYKPFAKPIEEGEK